MSYRYMRILIFFDLPTITYGDRREYTRFRKFLIRSGFIMMQESVYCKLAHNLTVAHAVKENIKKNKPKSGLVQMLTITEKQFEKMDLIIGYISSNVIDSDERLIIL